MSTIGLVTEGHTDQVVIEHLLNCYARSKKINRAVTCRRLQPPADRTSGETSGNGGWEQVYQWCLKNRRFYERFQAPPPAMTWFANDTDSDCCDKIIIHLDADLLDRADSRLFEFSHVQERPSDTSTPTERGLFLRDTLYGWLCPDQGELDPRHILAPAVEAIETWLVAGLCDDAEPETNRHVARRLVECAFFLRGRPVPPKAKKLNKKERNYQRLAQQAGQEIDRIAARCPHFKMLADAVFA